MNLWVLYVAWACDRFSAAIPYPNILLGTVCLPWSQCLLLLLTEEFRDAVLQLFSVHSNDRAREEKVNFQTFQTEFETSPEVKDAIFNN